jgi:polyhydroxyalkanoate synthesis regulator phasin
MMNKKLATALVSVGIVGAMGAGFALGTPGISTAQDETTTTVAAAPTEDGAFEPGDRLREVLQPLVDDGTLTEAQRDAVVDTLVAARPEGGFGHHGRGGPGRMHIGQAVLDTLGMTADELRTELQSGKTIADVAAEKGVSVDTVVAAIVTEMNERIDQAVADGRLTEDEAAERKANAEEKATDIVNGELPMRGPRGPMGPDEAPAGSDGTN